MLDKCLYHQQRGVYNILLRDNVGYTTEHIAQCYFYLYVCGLMHQGVKWLSLKRINYLGIFDFPQ